LPNEPIWVPVEIIVEHNRLELADTGEHHFARDRGLLESALARPRNAFVYGEEDIVALAVALTAGVARAHAFEQGNKRTAFAAMRLFLRANGYETMFADAINWAEEMIKLVEHRLSEEEFAIALRPFVGLRQVPNWSEIIVVPHVGDEGCPKCGNGTFDFEPGFSVDDGPSALIRCLACGYVCRDHELYRDGS
jgi:death-on-curing protein